MVTGSTIFEQTLLSRWRKTHYADTEESHSIIQAFRNGRGRLWLGDTGRDGN